MVRLPPVRHQPALEDLVNRLLSVRPGDDVQSLRQEISRQFYAVGDTRGGNQVNAILSDLMEPGMRDQDRRAIADELAHFAHADPVEVVQFAKDMVIGALTAGISKLARLRSDIRAAREALAAKRLEEKFEITFGQDGGYHAYRHTRVEHFLDEEVTTAILEYLKTEGKNIPIGKGLFVDILLRGRIVKYRVFRRSGSLVNVGRITVK